MKKSTFKMKRAKAFTLLEMAVVMIIIGLLLLLMIPNIQSVRQNADNRQANAMVEMVQTQVNLYMAENPEVKVTIEGLKTANYLTEDQVKRAKKAKVEISDKGEVSRGN